MGGYYVGVDAVVVVVTVTVSRSVVVVAVVVVAPEAAAARSLLVADSISATTGGVTAAKRPAFSRNRRRSAFFAVQFAASSDMSVPHSLPSKLLSHPTMQAIWPPAVLQDSLAPGTKVELPPAASGTSRRNTRSSHAIAADWEYRRPRSRAERTCTA